MSACIIPTTPDFQDPLAGTNYAPYIVSATPDFGSIVASQTPTFTVTATDLNIGDDLHFRWLADYPSTSGNYRTLVEDSVHVHSQDGTPLQATDRFAVDCAADNLAMTADGQHRIEAIVADRAFVQNPSDGKLDEVVEPGLVTRAFWIIQVACSSQ